MPFRIFTPLLIALVLWTSPTPGAEADSITGIWSTPERDAHFEIYRCGNEYCGRIVWLEEPNYPPEHLSVAGLPKLDRKNPDPALRDRTLLGLTIIQGLRYEGENSWRGRIYNPEDGNTYKCKLSVAESRDRLIVRGYLGVTLLGRTQTWTRVGRRNQELNAQAVSSG